MVKRLSSPPVYGNGVPRLRPFLNRLFPLDALARWWFVLLAGSVVGLVFALSTDFHPLTIPLKEIVVVEGPPFFIQSVKVETAQLWREDLFFAILGLLIASLIVYLLEDLPRNNQ